MDIVRCEKGHFYDASINSSCPQCAAESYGGGMSFGAAENYGGGMSLGAAVPGVPDDIGPTGPVGGVDPIGPTEPVNAGYAGGIGPTAPVDSSGFAPSDFVSGTGGQSGPIQAYDPTQPVWANGTLGFNPVTGWLVCIDGPDKGTDYRIHSGYNYIGRAQHMDICILNDSHISHDKHALIGYDDESQMFFFAPSNGRNIIRVNDKPVITSVELKPYDVLTIGTTKLCFVPFCGERFSWNSGK